MQTAQELFKATKKAAAAVYHNASTRFTDGG
ncbi:MAG: gamma-glutamyl phosphate reductase [Spirosomataceae bacterium]|jgi:gamma-glutamyl phosphate reductase